jgi:CspA family cold shock protein
MKTGIVKWFNLNKGFGFIKPDDGGNDVFVHVTALKQAKISNLSENQKIGFELSTENGKVSAVNLQLLKSSE